MKSIQIIVHGAVQGVGFRYHTQRQAEHLGVRGYVKNRPDGTVEIIAEGDPAAVDELLRWARQGPPSARVTQLITQIQAPRGTYTQFAIER